MPKPWKDKDTIPYQRQSDSDGGAVGTEPHKYGPGEGGFTSPNPNPGGNSANRELGGTD